MRQQQEQNTTSTHLIQMYQDSFRPVTYCVDVPKNFRIVRPYDDTFLYYTVEPKQMKNGLSILSLQFFSPRVMEDPAEYSMPTCDDLLEEIKSEEANINMKTIPLQYGELMGYWVNYDVVNLNPTPQSKQKISVECLILSTNSSDPEKYLGFKGGYYADNEHYNGIYHDILSIRNQLCVPFLKVFIYRSQEKQGFL